MNWLEIILTSLAMKYRGEVDTLMKGCIHSKCYKLILIMSFKDNYSQSKK